MKKMLLASNYLWKKQNRGLRPESIKQLKQIPPSKNIKANSSLFNMLLTNFINKNMFELIYRAIILMILLDIMFSLEQIIKLLN